MRLLPDTPAKFDNVVNAGRPEARVLNNAALLQGRFQIRRAAKPHNACAFQFRRAHMTR